MARNYVIETAQGPCPDCRGDGWYHFSDWGPMYKCARCKGTGIIYWQVKREKSFKRAII